MRAIQHLLPVLAFLAALSAVAILSAMFYFMQTYQADLMRFYFSKAFGGDFAGFIHDFSLFGGPFLWLYALEVGIIVANVSSQQ